MKECRVRENPFCGQVGMRCLMGGYPNPVRCDFSVNGWRWLGPSSV